VQAQPEVPLAAAPPPADAERMTQPAQREEREERDEAHGPVPVGPDAVPLIFPRLNLEHGCAPRRAFRCAIPISEVCSPAPRRSSVRPAAEDFATSSGAGPARGLG